MGELERLEASYGFGAWIHGWQRPMVWIPRPGGFLVAEPRPILWRGEWTLYYARKIGLPTPRAARLLAGSLGAKDYAYYGLKDTHAVAYQHIGLLRPRVRPRHIVLGPSLEAWLVADRVARPVPGMHAWNSFRIVLEDGGVPCRSGYEFPNYYGPQRFGTCRPTTHVAGIHLLRGDVEEALRIVGSRRLDRFTRSILVSGVQAYVWNRALSLVLAERGPSLEGAPRATPSCPRHASPGRVPALPLPGEKRLGPSWWDRAVDLVLEELGLDRRGLRGLKQHPRPAVLRPCTSLCRRSGGSLVHVFSLPRGAYATVYLREGYLVDWRRECPRSGPASI